MGKEDGLAFRVVKKLLEALYLLAIIGTVWLGILVFKSKDQSGQTKGTFIGIIILLVISLICAIIALIGVLKENKCIIITMTVFSVLGVIVHIVQGDIGSAIVSLLCAILTGVFAHMIIQKEKKNAESANTNTKV